MVEAAAENEPRADARGHHHVDDVGAARGRRRRRPPRARPRLASLSSSTGISSRRESSSPAWMPAQSGRTVDPSTPLWLSMGAASAIPAPMTRPRSTPASNSTSSASSAAASSDSSGALVDVELDDALREDGRREVGHGHPDVAVAEVDAESRRRRPRRDGGGPAGGRVPPRSARAPASRRSGRGPGGRRRARRPSSSRCPVVRARSVRLAVPARRSASTTRRRFSSRMRAECSLLHRHRSSLVPPFSTLSHVSGSNFTPPRPGNTPRPRAIIA